MVWKAEPIARCTNRRYPVAQLFCRVWMAPCWRGLFLVAACLVQSWAASLARKKASAKAWLPGLKRDAVCGIAVLIAALAAGIYVLGELGLPGVRRFTLAAALAGGAGRVGEIRIDRQAFSRPVRPFETCWPPACRRPRRARSHGTPGAGGLVGPSAAKPNRCRRRRRSMRPSTCTVWRPAGRTSRAPAAL